MLYTILTSLIILIGRVRDRLCRPMSLRYDRTLPCPPEWGPQVLFFTCCDCGLTHFFVPGHSGTPRRPASYEYELRLGAKAWTDPDPKLGLKAKYEFHKWIGGDWKVLHEDSELLSEWTPEDEEGGAS
jgi:hypothetical protein